MLSRGLVLILILGLTLPLFEAKPAAHARIDNSYLLGNYKVEGNKIPVEGKSSVPYIPIDHIPEDVPMPLNNELENNGTSTTTQAPETIDDEDKVIVTVYAFNNHVEPKMDYIVGSNDGCVTLQRRWFRRVSSVDTHGKCIRMCQYKDCKGSCITVKPGSPFHDRLRVLNFDKKTTSLKRC